MHATSTLQQPICDGLLALAQLKAIASHRRRSEAPLVAGIVDQLPCRAASAASVRRRARRSSKAAKAFAKDFLAAPQHSDRRLRRVRPKLDPALAYARSPRIATGAHRS